jgi:toxin ParE1/3/4
MNWRIVRRPEARRDIVETAIYLEERNPDAALRFLAAVEETLAAIAALPGMGALRPFRHPRLAGLRMLPVRGFGHHLIFYRQTEEGIEVVRVLHGARDIEAISTDEG